MSLLEIMLLKAFVSYCKKIILSSLTRAVNLSDKCVINMNFKFIL